MLNIPYHMNTEKLKLSRPLANKSVCKTFLIHKQATA